MKGVDKEKVNVCRRLRKVRDDDKKDESKDDAAQGEYFHIFPKTVMPVLAFPVVVEEDECRDGQQVQKVDSDGKAHQQGNQDDPPVCVGLVGLLVPFGHCPEHKSGEQG